MDNHAAVYEPIPWQDQCKLHSFASFYTNNGLKLFFSMSEYFLHTPPPSSASALHKLGTTFSFSSFQTDNLGHRIKRKFVSWNLAFNFYKDKSNTATQIQFFWTCLAFRWLSFNICTGTCTQIHKYSRVFLFLLPYSCLWKFCLEKCCLSFLVTPFCLLARHFLPARFIHYADGCLSWPQCVTGPNFSS